jgi:hypothetical protein
MALRNPFRRRPITAGAAGQPTVADGTTAPADRAAGAAAGPGTAQLAAARGAWAVGSVLIAIARVVRLVAGVVALIIVAAILLRVFSANPANSIVKDIHDAASTLVGPFKDVFNIKNPKVSIAVNWGLAAIVYLIVGGIVASWIARIAPRPALIRRHSTRAAAV